MVFFNLVGVANGCATLFVRDAAFPFIHAARLYPPRLHRRSQEWELVPALSSLPPRPDLLEPALKLLPRQYAVLSGAPLFLDSTDPYY